VPGNYVPKHAGWLNMVKIEIGVLRCQCLDRRIDSTKRVVSEIAAWERQRNTSCAGINERSQPRKREPKWDAPTRCSLQRVKIAVTRYQSGFRQVQAPKQPHRPRPYYARMSRLTIPAHRPRAIEQIKYARATFASTYFPSDRGRSQNRKT
jgi:hypothetical protein